VPTGASLLCDKRRFAKLVGGAHHTEQTVSLRRGVIVKWITWICDTCRKEAINFALPPGWVEASFFKERFYRYSLCSYPCLIL
jgi:hypothetical protein